MIKDMKGEKYLKLPKRKIILQRKDKQGNQQCLLSSDPRNEK